MGAAYSATTIITLAVEIRRKTVEHVVTHYINIVNPENHLKRRIHHWAAWSHSQPLLLQKLDELICEKQTGPVWCYQKQNCLLQAGHVSIIDLIQKIESERANDIRTLHSVRELHKQVLLFDASWKDRRSSWLQPGSKRPCLVSTRRHPKMRHNWKSCVAGIMCHISPKHF